MKTPKGKKQPAAPAIEGARQFTKARSLAKRVGLSTRTLFRWADQGLITRHKINARVVLFDEAEVTAFIAASAVKSPYEDTAA